MGVLPTPRVRSNEWRYRGSLMCWANFTAKMFRQNQTEAASRFGRPHEPTFLDRPRRS
jgi:hypothetical protein